VTQTKTGLSVVRTFSPLGVKHNVFKHHLDPTVDINIKKATTLMLEFTFAR
jgi:hypothetical protein